MGEGIQPHLFSAELDEDLAVWTCAVLAGAPALPSRPAVSAGEFLRYLDFHGVTGLLLSHVMARPDRGSLDDDAIAPIRLAAARSVVKEVLLKEELGRLLSAAEDQNLRPLLLKGTALAYSVYPEPALRARNDIDVLVAPERKREMEALLTAHGYVADLIAGGLWATSELGFTKSLAGDVISRIDLHWRLNNSPLFWHRGLDYDRISLDALPLPSLHRHARAPNRLMLLLHACLHRAGHLRAPIRVNGVAYGVMNRLIWLYDIHLLAAGLNPDAWRAFVQAADALRIRQICRAGLAAAATRLRTPIPADVLATLNEGGPEPSSRHLDAPAWAVKLAEFRAVPASARWPWLREHLFPNAEYMRARFADRPGTPLALLYVRRILSR